MSYDLMVFDPTVAPKERKDFMKWYAQQTEWEEDHSYQDNEVSTEGLQAWFKDMIEYFPPMNGPLASEDDDNPKVTDHCVGKHVIYSAFSWSVAEEAYPKMRELSIKHSIGFFDASADNGEILFPSSAVELEVTKPWWKFW
ncbi:hypothetical protein [Marinicella rhabdoformis]|uniref:hypothetical protein n=1 Tax=Marinicella rhabdoformis TaxID=2580566 RepID=UPI0012AED7E9|nr:hypothetical protein [Marinicella rhabdoformis]